MPWHGTTVRMVQRRWLPLPRPQCVLCHANEHFCCEQLRAAAVGEAFQSIMRYKWTELTTAAARFKNACAFRLC